MDTLHAGWRGEQQELLFLPEVWVPSTTIPKCFILIALKERCQSCCQGSDKGRAEQVWYQTLVPASASLGQGLTVH